MNKIASGIIAGFIATLVISAIMIFKAKMGMLPTLNPIADNAGLLGLPHMLILGWGMHFLIGTIAWGILFALFSMITDNISSLTRGFIFGILAWLLMMMGFMPAAGHGFFAIDLGIPVIMMTLVIHIIYGLVLGIMYGLIVKRN